MKRIICILLLIIFITPVSVMAQEDGWKDLKWGMTLEELKQVFANEKTPEKCEMSMDGLKTAYYGSFVIANLLRHYDKKSDDSALAKQLFLSNSKPLIEAVWCGDNYRGEYTGIMLYNKKFFGKEIGFPSEFQQEIMQQLKDKYPKGKMSYETLTNSGKYPVFEYISSSIVVLSELSRVVRFFDAKAVNEMMTLYFKAKQEKEEQAKKARKIF